MSVPYLFSNAPGGTSIPLAELDANFEYMTTNPTLENLTLTGNLTVDGTSTFNSMVSVNGGIKLAGGVTVNGQTAFPTGFTGTGLWVLNDGPQLIAPDLGTPASGILTNCTGLPLMTGITGLANGVADFLAVPSSYNLHEAMLDETGQGLLVFNEAPVLIDVNMQGSNTVTGDLDISRNFSVGNDTTLNNVTINGAITIDGQTINPTGFTGSGLIVLNDGPTIIDANLQSPVMSNANLGSPVSGVLTNCTGLPLDTGVVGVLPIANGGTNATTAAGALNNLLPSQTGNSREYLQTDGSGTVIWSPAISNIINIAALRSLTPLANQNVNVGGYYTNGDGGGGQFYGVTTGGPYTDNGGTIIVPGGGTGASAWIRVINGPISVKWFGAKGDGITDDAASIQASLSFLSSNLGGDLVFPPATYKINSVINQSFGNNVVVNISGYGAKIDGTSVVGVIPGDTILIKLTGSRAASSSLAANVVTGMFTLTSTSTFGVQTNDIILISSTDLWNPTRPYYLKGEFEEVASVSGTTILGSYGLFDSYTAATTTLHRLNMPSISIEGLEIEMNAPQLALSVEYSRNPQISNMKVHGARYSGVQLFYCYGGSVHNCNVYDAWVVGNVSSYGVTIATCQGTTVTSNLLSQARHSIATGGIEPCRMLVYSDNICTMHPNQGGALAIDVHGNCEYVTIVNNYAEGISVAGINISILGNTVITNQSYNAINIFQEISSVYYDIKNNYIIINGVTAQGVWVSPTQPNISINNLNIDSNTIISNFQGISITPRNPTVTGHLIYICEINGNTVKCVNANAFIVNDSGGTAGTIRQLLLSDNVFSSEVEDSLYLSNLYNVENFQSSSDRFYTGKLNGHICYFTGDNIKVFNPYFDGDLFQNGNVSADIIYYGSATIQAISPTYNNITNRANIQTGTEFIENGATGNVTPILNAAGAKFVTTYTVSGTAVSSLTAAPIAGSWAQGDIVWNSTPAVGQPKGWMCTVSGAPGTWISMGNL